jgi:hypothetical protein
MRTTRPLSALQRPAWQADALEWEELPSLADSLAQRLVVLGERHRGLAEDGPESRYDWAVTQAAGLDPLTPSEPFRETLQGLAMREVNEPDVFRHFFGASAAR